MPTYNGSRYIANAIESALNQTFKDFELIVVNDGSTDNTEEIVKEYQKKDNRIRYFYKPNGGVGNAYNFGIRKANGKYISVFEHDDISVAKRLAKQIEVLDKNENISLVYSSIIPFSGHNSPSDIYAPYKRTKMSTKEFFKALIMHGCFCNDPSITYRRDVTNFVMYDESLGKKGLGHDFLFFLEASQKFGFHYMKEPLVYWRRGHNNLSWNYIDVFEAHKNAIDKVFNGKKHIFGISRSTAFSMLYMHHARLAITSQRLKSKWLIYLSFIIRAFLNNPLNFSIYKTIVWTFTKRLWKTYTRKKAKKSMNAANYLLNFGK
jgi:glycosyltransferase involved in cell wall biosynthesis